MIISAYEEKACEEGRESRLENEVMIMYLLLYITIKRPQEFLGDNYLPRTMREVANLSAEDLKP